MLTLCALLGFLVITETFARQPPGNPQALTVYSTGTPGQYLVQPTPRGPPQDIPRQFPQIAVVVVPRPPEQNLYSSAYPRPGDGVTQQPNLHYKQSPDGFQLPRQEPAQISKPGPFAPLPPLIRITYPKPKNPIEQFLKEVVPTTKTAYSEQQSASLRYAQATAPPQPEDLDDPLKLTAERVTLQQFPSPHAVPQQVQQDPNQQQPQPQQYQQIAQPQQYVQQPQDYGQQQQYVQPNTYSGAPIQFAGRDDSPTQQPKYQQVPLQSQNTQDGLTYIPINPVMFQKPLVDDDGPTPKSAIFVTQRTPVKKYQRLQPVTEDSEDQLAKLQAAVKKLVRPQLQQYQQIQQLQPQQFLIPILPQQSAPSNQEIQVQLQPQPVKYHIQQLQGEPLKYQQIQPEQVSEQQQVYQQIRPKKVLSQVVRQQLPPQIIAYQPYPIPQPVPAESYPEQQLYQQHQQQQQQQLQQQQIQQVNLLKQPLVRYQLQPQSQLLAVQPANLRHPQQPQEALEYEQVQQPVQQQQETQTEPEKTEEKQETQQPEPTPPRLSAKYRKSSLRSRKYRPTPPRVHHENEDEVQSETQEHHQEYQEDFRIQYSDSLKPQATNFPGSRYRRPLHTNPRVSPRNNKDRAVQIIDEDDDEYK